MFTINLAGSQCLGTGMTLKGYLNDIVLVDNVHTSVCHMLKLLVSHTEKKILLSLYVGITKRIITRYLPLASIWFLTSVPFNFPDSSIEPFLISGLV
ncbi:MAG: hypothetical protein ACR5KV_04165 [Wolbachia sp.]